MPGKDFGEGLMPAPGILDSHLITETKTMFIDAFLVARMLVDSSRRSDHFFLASKIRLSFLRGFSI
jgi:hypothetical protein